MLWPSVCTRPPRDYLSMNYIEPVLIKFNWIPISCRSSIKLFIIYTCLLWYNLNKIHLHVIIIIQRHSIHTNTWIQSNKQLPPDIICVCIITKRTCTVLPTTKFYQLQMSTRNIMLHVNLVNVQEVKTEPYIWGRIVKMHVQTPTHFKSLLITMNGYMLGGLHRHNNLNNISIRNDDFSCLKLNNLLYLLAKDFTSSLYCFSAIYNSY